jgi:hypothetical protein
MWLAIMELSVTKMVDPSTLKDLIASCTSSLSAETPLKPYLSDVFISNIKK